MFAHLSEKILAGDCRESDAKNRAPLIRVLTSGLDEEDIEALGTGQEAKNAVARLKVLQFKDLVPHRLLMRALQGGHLEQVLPL
jgi:hypothetical protein